MAELELAENLSGTDLGLDFALSDLLVATVGGQEFVYAISRSGNAIVTLDITATGNLLPLDVMPVTGWPRAGVDNKLALLGDDLLVMSGFFSGTGQGVSLGAGGLPEAQTPVSGASVFVAPSSITMDGTAYVFTGRASQGAVRLLERTGTTDFALTGIVEDSDDLYLGDTVATAVVTAHGAPWFLSASGLENGVTLLTLDAGGALIASDALGAAEGLPVSAPDAMAAVTSGGTGWVTVAASGTSSLSLLEVTVDGTLEVRDHILDTAGTRFQRASSVDMLAVGDLLVVAAAGTEGGVSLFLVLPHGQFIHLDSIEGTSAVSDLALYAVDGVLSVVASGDTDAGVSRYSYDLSGVALVGGAGGAGPDVVLGTDLADTLTGGAGEDILFDGGGTDRVWGGTGADLFVFGEDGASDTVADFEKLVDRLDLSAWGGLSSAAQLEVLSTPDGATLLFRAEVLKIETADGSSLDASDFSDANVLNVDRPEVIPLAQDLTGTPGDDTLIGGGGYDTLAGDGGNDLLQGGGLDDELSGDAGNDTLHGESGVDTLVGGDGADSIMGGSGGDLIYGDSFDMA